MWRCDVHQEVGASLAKHCTTCKNPNLPSLDRNMMARWCQILLNIYCCLSAAKGILPSPRWPRLFARLSTSICLSKELRTLTTCQSFEQFGKGRRTLPEPETLHEATMQIAAALNLQSQPANSSCHRTRAAPLAAPRAPSCHPSRLPVQTQH